MKERYRLGGDGVYLPEEEQAGSVNRYLREAHNAGLDTRRVDARNRFLEAAAELDATLLRSLQTDVLPLYNHRWTTDERLSELRHLHHGYEAVSRVRDLLSPFGLALVEWLERWHLTETWALNAALWTVESWMPLPRYARAPRRLVWRFNNPRVSYPPVIGRIEVNETFEQLAGESTDDFLKRVAARLEANLEGYRAHVNSEGYLPTPVKTAKHFQWCALRQVWGYSYALIAQAVNRERQSVESAAREAFEHIGMTPRKLLVGRRSGYSGKDYLEEKEKKIRRMMGLEN